MRHPVYPFSAVLRELRRDAGLTILAAADATAYGNYECWESGQTRIGTHHLRAIAEAFAVGDDLALLLYAWALDQLSPAAGQPARRYSLDDLRDRLRLVPDTEVDLGEHKPLVIEPPRHVDLTLCYLGARYRAADGIVLPPAERAVLPSREPSVPILGYLYGDVFGDYMSAVGEALLARGIDGRSDAIDVTNIEPALEDPDVFRDEGHRQRHLLLVRASRARSLHEGVAGGLIEGRGAPGPEPEQAPSSLSAGSRPPRSEFTRPGGSDEADRP